MRKDPRIARLETKIMMRILAGLLALCIFLTIVGVYVAHEQIIQESGIDE